jgi:hypothetical protein
MINGKGVLVAIGTKSHFFQGFNAKNNPALVCRMYVFIVPNPILHGRVVVDGSEPKLPCLPFMGDRSERTSSRRGPMLTRSTR